MSIGLPTRNGERFIAEALRSLLGQDHPHLEIVVSDNASTDRTSDIVGEFMARDGRIRYQQVEVPVSASENFNRVFAASVGPYFMWAADDDVWAPSYVRRCLAALIADPRLVMASSGLRFIDLAGRPIDADYSRYDNPDLSSPSTIERVRLLLRRGGWYQVYGLARRDALERTRLFQDVYGPDVVLVFELAMVGPIARIPETLFWYRRFPGRTEAVRAERQGGIPDASIVASAPATHLQEALSDAVRQASLPSLLKVRLRGEILRAAYIADTPLRSRARPEAWKRAQASARAGEVRRTAKFALADGLGRLARVSAALRRWMRRARRVVSRR